MAAGLLRPSFLIRMAALMGAMAPLLFLAGLALASRLQQEFMKEVGWGVWPHGLSVGPRGWLYTASAIALGLPMLAFAFGVYAAAANRKGRVAAGLLGLAGVGALLFSMKTDLLQHRGTFYTANVFDAETWPALVSGIGFLLFVPAIISAYFFFWFGVRHEPGWRRTRTYSLYALVLLLPALALPALRPLAGYAFLAIILAPLAAFALRTFAARASER